jgi:uncharacterized protein (TIGR03437 family)
LSTTDAILEQAPASQAAVTFDLDTGTPILAARQSTPFTQTSGGITASFSSPSGAAFSIQSDSTTGWHLSRFSGNYISDNNLNANVLVVQFSQPITSISFTFATADFQQVEVPTTIQMKAYLDSDQTPAVGSQTAHGAYAGDTMPMGTLSFTSSGQSFNLVEISIAPSQPLGAADFLVDNITVTGSPALATVSAASFAPDAPLAAAMMVAGYGQGLASATAIAPPDAPLPVSLAGTTVTVTDSAGTARPCPLWYVSDAQINYYIPDGTAAGAALVTVVSQTQVVAVGQLQVENVSPGLFSVNSNGQGAAAALAIWTKPDWSQTWQYVFPTGCVPGSCLTTPLDLRAPAEQMYLILFGTGIRGRSSLAGVSAQIGGVDVTVEYAGPVAGLVGLDQLNLVVPAVLAGRGEVDVTVTVDGKTSNAVKVNFR